MECQVTQYGYHGDPDGDSLTEGGWGAWNNKLTEDGCALTASLAAKLAIEPLKWVHITFNNGCAPLMRQYQDKAPEGNDRCDLYMPSGFNTFIPDTADIQKA